MRGARAGRAAALTFAIATALLGCGEPQPEPGPTALAAGAVEPTSEAKARARQLFERLAPPPPSATSEQSDAWVVDARAILENMALESPDVGLALLALAMQEEEAGSTARRAAIEGGAKAAGPQAGDLLEALVVEYGPPMELREAAVRALPSADPARALRVLEPLLSERPRKTLPPIESLLVAYIDAAKAAGIDPVPVVALVAADLHQDDSTRIRAVRELGGFDTPLAIATAEELLVETTGNNYLRRIAAQSLMASAPRERACAVLHRVLEREVDPHMLEVLADFVERHCP